MSMLEFVAIRDLAVETFNRPFVCRSVGEAMRLFEDEVNRVSEDNPMHKHPKDFALFHVGSFDDEQGRLIPLDIAVRLADAVSVLRVNKET